MKFIFLFGKKKKKTGFSRVQARSLLCCIVKGDMLIHITFAWFNVRTTSKTTSTKERMVTSHSRKPKHTDHNKHNWTIYFLLLFKRKCLPLPPQGPIPTLLVFLFEYFSHLYLQTKSTSEVNSLTSMRYVTEIQLKHTMIVNSYPISASIFWRATEDDPNIIYTTV